MGNALRTGPITQGHYVNVDILNYFKVSYFREILALNMRSPMITISTGNYQES